MKTYVLILFLLFEVLICAAQDYKLTFSLEGEVNSIDSVIVENVTRNTKIKLNGNDTLFLTKTTGINTLPNLEALRLKAFPNPTSSIVNLQFTTNKSENVSTRIFNIEGKEMISKRWSVFPGIHTFQVKNLPNGIFIAQVNTMNTSEQIKIVSFQSKNRVPEIGSVYSELLKEPGLRTKSTADARLLGYEVYDNIVVRVWPTDAPWELRRGFTITEEEPPVEENNTFVFEYVKCEDKCGNTYNTVQIGKQIWMAENYRCPTEDSWVYDDDANNEELYGRLYTWEDALNNAPKGWHLPTNAEWLEMTKYLENIYSDETLKALKSKTGWLPDENQNNTNGDDASGFNIVPGGARWFYDESFYNVGNAAYFWTSTRSDSIRAYMRKFAGSDTEIIKGSSVVDYGFSVRYVKDSVDYGTFFDERDGQTYKTITIGEQTWMAENLKFGDNPVTDYKEWQELGANYIYLKSGYCWYDNDENNKNLYGVLYNYSAAINACPNGWHLPSDAEWTILADFLGNNGYGYDGNEFYIGKALASTTSWNLSKISGHIGKDAGSNNSTGFSGTAGGYRDMWGGFCGRGSWGIWWSSTEYDNHLWEDTEYWIRELNYEAASLIRNSGEENWGCYVRCIKD